MPAVAARHYRLTMLHTRTGHGHDQAGHAGPSLDAASAPAFSPRRRFQQAQQARFTRQAALLAAASRADVELLADFASRILLIRSPHDARAVTARSVEAPNATSALATIAHQHDERPSELMRT